MLAGALSGKRIPFDGWRIRYDSFAIGVKSRIREWVPATLMKSTRKLFVWRRRWRMHFAEKRKCKSSFVGSVVVHCVLVIICINWSRIRLVALRISWTFRAKSIQLHALPAQYFHWSYVHPRRFELDWHHNSRVLQSKRIFLTRKIPAKLK